MRLKALTPDQMLSRLRITLAQLKAGNSCTPCVDQKNQPKQSITV